MYMLRRLITTTLIFLITAHLFSLDLITPSEARPLEPVVVSVDSKYGNDAWVGFFTIDASDQDYLAWSYVRDLNDSQFTTIAPKNYGVYEFRSFKDSGYERAKVSEQIKVVPYEPVFFVSPMPLIPGNNATVRVIDAPNARNATDVWIALYRESDPDETYLAWSYLRDLQNHEFTVTVPEERDNYEFRLFLDSGYFRIGNSSSPAVTDRRKDNGSYHPCQTIGFRFDSPGGNDAWIGIFKSDEDDGAYIKWAYLRDIDGPMWEISVPKELGTYEFRVFIDSGSTRHQVSDPINVTQFVPVFTITQTRVQKGAPVIVTIKDPTVCPGAWVGLYVEGDADTSYIAYQYIDELENGEYRIAAPQSSGHYRFRVFLDADFTLLGESDRLTVE
jgi:hypothetical protein